MCKRALSSLILTFLLIVKVNAFDISGNISWQTDQDSIDYQNARKCFDDADYECAEQIYKKLIIKARKLNDSLLIAKITLDLGELHYTLGNFEASSQLLDSAFEVAEKTNEKKLMADAQQWMAHIDWRYGDNFSALNKINESIKLYQQIKDTSSELQAQSILAGIYISVKKFEECKLLYDDLLETAKIKKDSTALATCFEHLGIIAFYEKKYDKAISRYKQALNINLARDKKIAAALNRANIGESYLFSGRLEKAKLFLEQSLQVLIDFEFTSGVIFVSHTLGKVYSELGDYKGANKYFDKSLQLMDETGEIRERSYVYKMISESKEKQGLHQEALSFYKKFFHEKDSLFGVEKTRQLEELKAQYELEDRLNENQRLNKQNKEAREEIYAKEKLITYQYIISAVISISLLLFIFQYYILRKSKRRLELSNNTKNRLFSIISHDIRNPVNNIGSLVDILERSENPKEQEQVFGMLKKSSRALSGLVKNILSWSISNIDGFTFKYENINLKETANKTLDLFIYHLNEKEMTFDIQIEQDYEIYSDKDAILTILRNLLSNAIKYTPKNGGIVIWHKSDAHYDKIGVKDSGKGMLEKTKNNLLNGFRVTSEDGTEHEQGTGLGFTIVYDFVKKLGGEIEINTSVNEGTEVIVKLPK